MDSTNSGSMQSSSGGDEIEEYDHDSSRLDSLSAFFNSSISNHQPPPPPLPHHHNPNNQPPLLIDPQQPNFFDTPFPHPTDPNPNPNSNSLLNFDMLWSKTLRSEPNCTTNITPTMVTTQNLPPLQTPLPHPRPSSASSTSDQTRTSKKRSRASRRAPTTVLTTDTSNFRAMVQEFTGIPAPPFSARTRLDLFSTRPPPPYLLRPFAQKLQPSPYAMASSSTNITSVVNSSNPNSSTNSNYQLLSELGLPNKQSHQNSILTFQSLLQSTPPPKYPLDNSPTLNAKSQGLSTIASMDSNPTMGLLEEFNMNHGNNVTTHPNHDFSNMDRDQGHLRSFNENYDNSLQANTYNMNTSSDFHVEKAIDHNTTSRGGGEGMVDSWICSSD